MKLKIQMLNGESYELPLNGRSEIIFTSESITYNQYWERGQYPKYSTLKIPEKYWLDEIEKFEFI